MLKFSRSNIWDFCQEAKYLISKAKKNTVVLPEIYELVKIVNFSPMGFSVEYANSLINAIPKAYREDYERYGLHFEVEAA